MTSDELRLYAALGVGMFTALLAAFLVALVESRDPTGFAFMLWLVVMFSFFLGASFTILGVALWFNYQDTKDLEEKHEQLSERIRAAAGQTVEL